MSRNLKIYACSGVGDVNVNTPKRVAENLEDNAWSRNETLRKYLGSSSDGGCAEYFLYIFIPETELSRYNSIIYRKREQQLKTFEYVRELFVGHDYGTEEEMIGIIRNGIEKTLGRSVEDVLASIRNGEQNSVGAPITMAVASIITAVIAAVVSIVLGIIQYCQSVNIAKYTAPSYEEVVDSAPSGDDFTGTTKKKGLLYGAIAGLALLIVGSLKN